MDQAVSDALVVTWLVFGVVMFIPVVAAVFCIKAARMATTASEFMRKSYNESVKTVNQVIGYYDQFEVEVKDKFAKHEKRIKALEPKKVARKKARVKR